MAQAKEPVRFGASHSREGFGLGPNSLALPIMKSGICPLSLGNAQRGRPPWERTVPGGFCVGDVGEGEGCGDSHRSAQSGSRT